MNKTRTSQWNSFSGRITILVMLGISIMAFTVSGVVLAMSQAVFTDTYGKSQEQVFHQIDNELNDFHTSLLNVVSAIDTSWAFRLYLSDDSRLDNVQNFQNIYQMEYDLNKSKTSDMERMNILVLGRNGKHYLSRTETISMSDEKIWESEAVQKAVLEPEAIQYTYAKGAYTATSSNNDVIIASKALYYRESEEIYAVVLVTLSRDDMKHYYDYFVSENTDWYLVDQNGTVVCSNQMAAVGNPLTEEWYLYAGKQEEERMVVKENGVNLTVLKKEMSYYGCTMYGVIDNDVALDELYNMPLLIFICAGIGIFVLASCLLFARKTVRPLSELVLKMSDSRKENFRSYVPVQGTIEVQKLANTYNDMLNDIQSYVKELMETQKAQRKAEIKALQMQISPHYIYNTLASIKWLVYKNDVEETTKTIDAFISLLRNTISNTDEFITVEQELVNLENYVLINHTRYGDAIQVEYYVAHDCYDCLLPKLVLQPFIENAFFHAFPSGQSGVIQIFIREIEQTLDIRIMDDGIGMDEDQAKDAIRQKKEHFSGIGIHNVQDRLQLLYGADYGITIESQKERGTSVKIRLPVHRKPEGENDNQERK